jgi:hypothetical protein
MRTADEPPGQPILLTLPGLTNTWTADYPQIPVTRHPIPLLIYYPTHF